MSLDDGTPSSDELLRLHAAAQSLVGEALRGLGPADLSRATPCSEWDLRALLEHMYGQNLGLMAAAGGDGADLEQWRPRALGLDPSAAIANSAGSLVVALAEGGLSGTMWMPEILPTAPLPARTAVLAHLLDSVVHGWDVAMALGKPFDAEPGVLAVAAAVADRVPSGDGRLRSGAAFGPPGQAPGGGQLADMLALLGRTQAFRPSDVA